MGNKVGGRAHNLLVCIDFETTGLIRDGEPMPGIVQCAMTCEGIDAFGATTTQKRMSMYVNPECKITQGSYKIHEIDDAMVMDKMTFSGGVAQEFAYSLLRWADELFSDKLPVIFHIVAHNGNNFDFRVMRNALHGCKVESLVAYRPDDAREASIIWHDTFPILKQLQMTGAFRLPNCKLMVAHETMGKPGRRASTERQGGVEQDRPEIKPHEALSDVICLSDICLHEAVLCVILKDVELL